MKELQERRFREQIEEILGTDCKVKPVVDESGTLHSAKVNTSQTLNAEKINGLLSVADAWCCEAELDRSGEGIRIQFTVNSAALPALQN